MSAGLKQEHVKNFGSKRISILQLNKNKLVLYYPSGKASHRFELITDDVKNIIKAIIRGDIYDVEERIDLLDDIDREQLFDAMKVSNVDLGIDDRVDSSKTKLIHDFNIYKSEITMGNRGPETLSKFRDIVEECRRTGLLHKPEYNRLLKLIADNIST